MNNLGTPIQIGNLNLSNRLVMAPLATWHSDVSGEVNEKHMIHYGERKGPGLVIVEATAVSPEGRLARTQLGIFEDRHIHGLKKLASLIQSNGSVPGIQIHHAGGQAPVETTYGLMQVPREPSNQGSVISRSTVPMDIWEPSSFHPSPIKEKTGMEALCRVASALFWKSILLWKKRLPEEPWSPYGWEPEKKMD